ncbi:DsbA family oxidoreductase [Aquabacterium sp. A08]|uniref:DsbA family oxidoreductase n=2 Tax=Aquabacterium sp. A08 TaxID=2718532 RepID=UPI00141F2664|nr:DsbA family oxidoreductase [Aquabacterium sp. A08]NIC41275.1 DsbA family oxidoreductase [Aquabacterium sp. A08]
MTQTVQIDFVSDISCPWCAVGLSSLALALERLHPEVVALVRVHPFELNPAMGPGGQDVGEHLTEKYGSTPEQQAQIRQTLVERGAAVGFTFHPEGRGRIYNTFNAHRLLHWAGEAHPERQLALKMALLLACHRDRQAMDEPAVLVQAAVDAGLDAVRAHAILASDAYADAVRESEAFFTQAGIRAVPAVIVNRRHLISGGQPVEAYERALRDLAAQATA